VLQSETVDVDTSLTQLSAVANRFWSVGPRNRVFVYGGAGTSFDDAPLPTNQFALGAPFRLGADSNVTLLNLDDRIVQVQLSQGTLKVRVRHLAPGQSFEVDTPNLAFTIRRPGDYRIDVDPNDDATAVSVQNGEAEVYGEGASYAVTPRQSYRFYGTGLSDADKQRLLAYLKTL
jgi:hypothetical protein